MPDAFEWPIDRIVWPELPPIGDDPDNPSDAYKTALAERNGAENMAVEILWALSGRQFGLNTQTVRPCRAPLHIAYRGDLAVTSYVVSWEGDGWYTWPCGCLGGRCEIRGPRVVHLPGPVYDVTTVTIAGDVLDPSGYQVEGNVLYRKGSVGTSPMWPRQDLHRPLGEVNTWSVTYRRGIPVPSGVDRLTAALAKEILDALNDEGRCRLPRTVTTVSRNGVSYRAYDPAVIYANGKTGMPEIDLWLASVNPYALMDSPSVI